MPKRTQSRVTSKGERTRERIVERAAVLFNTRGVAGTAMADISEATGLEKGGVYNHFASKEALALVAFDYAAAVVIANIDAALATPADCLARLRAVVDLYRQSTRPFIAGGCPLMNTAIEADDTNPEMRRRARARFEELLSRFSTIFEQGVRCGEISAVEPRAAASAMLATIEGAVMLSRLYSDRSHMRAALYHLDRFLDDLRPASCRSRA